MSDLGQKPAENVDFDLIATSYRSLTEPAAFDEMIAAWNRKLAAVEDEADWNEQRLGQDLFGHLSRLGSLAENTAAVAEDPIRQTVEATEVATMVQTPEGRVVAINDAGMALFGPLAGSIDPLDWLDATSTADLAALRRSAAENGNRQRAILRHAEMDGSTDQLVEAQVLKVPGSDTGFVTIRSLALPWSPGVGEALAEAFALTEAELDVLRLFYLSRDLDDVSLARGVSIKTVRTQFKTILMKTQARSQTNLLHLVAMLCARVAADRSGTEMGWSDPFGSEQIFTRPGGKKLAYSTIGPAHARPVLWVHGPGFNGIPPQSLIDRIITAGGRLILPCRPAYGNSERDHAQGIEEDQASALAELAEELGLQACLAVGTTCSAQALHLARDKVPHRIGTVVAISFSWKASSEEVRRLPAVHRTVYSLAQRAPSILRSICSVALRIIRRVGPDWYVQRAHSYSQANRACLRNPETQALLRSDCRMMLAQGTEGFISDLLLAYADTSGALTRSTSPTVWLMGELDQHLHLEEARLFCTRYPGISLKVLPGCSELMVYQRPELVADAIVEALCMRA
ncbi:hypothetical protein SZ64_09990 [Erythrobacter sp. SG61-1L]|uniref:alpha/beta hydrolase n=1 Tax=Erythrobacter sp. SG61-1L TaxID=1603897 RepID=UPI0006C908B5|nr:alpha/beta hydrolase [Erythrobacter sp. SG61-1L]KPL68420.1 hypothetical protein SZ64_09990 [Erythrobacter sp. SG61-1L]